MILFFLVSLSALSQVGHSEGSAKLCYLNNQKPAQIVQPLFPRAIVFGLACWFEICCGQLLLSTGLGLLQYPFLVLFLRHWLQNACNKKTNCKSADCTLTYCEQCETNFSLPVLTVNSSCMPLGFLLQLKSFL